MDYAAWLTRLQAFVARWHARMPPGEAGEYKFVLDPPLTADELADLRESLEVPLPASVAGFLTTAASRIVLSCPIVNADGQRDSIDCELFNYWWHRTQPCAYDDEFGGPLEYMSLCRDDAREYAVECWPSEPEWVLDRALWRHALPLTRWPNTDGLALWAHDPEEAEPAVVWLAHADQSYILSPSFDHFLTFLEAAGYGWGENDRNVHTGLLDAASATARNRRRLSALEDS